MLLAMRWIESFPRGAHIVIADRDEARGHLKLISYAMTPAELKLWHFPRLRMRSMLLRQVEIVR